MATTNEAPRDGARILVVDDEPLLLKAYRRMIPARHEVVRAQGGAEALSLLELDAAFDVIFCDLQMPEVSGADLYHSIRQRWPALVARLVFVTGDAFAEAPRRFLDESGCRYVNKPFDAAEILRVIEALWPCAPVTLR